MLRGCAGVPELELLQEGADPSQQIAPPCSLPSCKSVAPRDAMSDCTPLLALPLSQIPSSCNCTSCDDSSRKASSQCL